MHILIDLLICIVIGLFIVIVLFVFAMARASAKMDDLMQARLCPDCPFNQERCEYDRRTCSYGEKQTP